MFSRPPPTQCVQYPPVFQTIFQTSNCRPKNRFVNAANDLATEVAAGHVASRNVCGTIFSASSPSPIETTVTENMANAINEIYEHYFMTPYNKEFATLLYTIGQSKIRDCGNNIESNDPKTQLWQNIISTAFTLEDLNHPPTQESDNEFLEHSPEERAFILKMIEFLQNLYAAEMREINLMSPFRY